MLRDASAVICVSRRMSSFRRFHDAAYLRLRLYQRMRAHQLRDA